MNREVSEEIQNKYIEMRKEITRKYWLHYLKALEKKLLMEYNPECEEYKLNDEEKRALMYFGNLKKKR